MHLHTEVWKASILPKSPTCPVDNLVRTTCDPQECTPGELSWCLDRCEGGCIALCYELNLVSAQCQRGPQRHKPAKGIAELPGARSLAGTQSLVLLHRVVVSSAFLHPPRVPARFSENSFSGYSPQATCLPVLGFWEKSTGSLQTFWITPLEWAQASSFKKLLSTL